MDLSGNKYTYVSQYELDALKRIDDCLTDRLPRFLSIRYEEISVEAPDENDEIVYIPVEGTFDRDFFVRMFILRKHQIVNTIVSPFDWFQYQIPVKLDNEALIMLVYGTHAMYPHVSLPHRESLGKTLCTGSLSKIINSSQVLSPLIEFYYLTEENRLTDPPGKVWEFQKNDHYKHITELKRKVYEWIEVTFKAAFNEYTSTGNRFVKWVEEYKLFNFVKFWYPDTFFQYTPEWLDGQSIDIFIPSIQTGVEYQGRQHYEAVDFFGGKEKYEERIVMDAQKAQRCSENKVNLKCWPYYNKVYFSSVEKMFGKNDQEAETLFHHTEGFPVMNLLVKAESFSEYKKRTRVKPEPKEKPLSVEIIREYSTSGELLNEYDTIKLASEGTGISMTSIQKCLAKQRKTSGGHVWIRERRNAPPASPEVIAEIISSKETKVNWNNESTPVMQVDRMTGEILKSFPSITSAAKSVGIDGKGIRDVLTGKQRSAGGYYWIQSTFE